MTSPPATPAPINIFKSFLKMSYILKKWQIISKKFENLTLSLWRPIEQGKISRTIFQCVPAAEARCTGGGAAVTRKNDMKLHQIFIAINVTIIPSFRM